MRAFGIAVEREEMIPIESDVDADVLTAANGVANIAVMRGVLRLQLHADTNGAVGSHRTTVGSACSQHLAQEADQRARLVALHGMARVLDDVCRAEICCAPSEF